MANGDSFSEPGMKSQDTHKKKFDFEFLVAIYTPV
jgi:hypothetical protein